MSKYAKAAVAVLAVLSAAAKALADGSVSSDELSVIVGAAVAAYGVYRVPNKTA